MTLQAVYKQFLAAPNSSVLAQNASLHYITTTTSFHGPTDIIKHLSAQRSQIKKNKEDLITVIEGQDALAVQTALAVEFLDNGGPYLPGLDDQFLSDRVVDIPVVSFCPHIPVAAVHTCDTDHVSSLPDATLQSNLLTSSLSVTLSFTL